MKLILRSLILLGVTAGMVTAAFAEPPADVILLGGKIITVDDQFSIQEAVAVAGDRIIAVGDSETIRGMAGPDTRIIDLEGRAVIPGLIDTHTHIMRASQLWKYEVRLDGVTDRDEALARLRAKAKTLEQGDWLLNFGGWVEQQFIGDPRGFTLAELDAIAPRNPVFLDVNLDHQYVNSRFLELAGIALVNKEAGPETKAGGVVYVPAPGAGNHFTESMIVRDGTGAATGRLNGTAAYVAARHLFPKLGEDEAVESLKLIVDDAVSVGLTTVYDGGGQGIEDASYERARRLAESGELNMRIYHTRFITARTPQQAAQAAAEFSKRMPFAGDDYYDLIGIGESVYVPALDGFASPARDTAETRWALTTVLGAAARQGYNVQQHMVRPETINLTLDIIDEIGKERSIQPLRWFVIHADLIDRPTLERVREHHMGLSFRTHFLLGSEHRTEETARLGGTGQAPPIRMAQDAGIAWTFGTETPRVNVLNPLMSLAFAITGRRFFDARTVLESTVTREQALIAHTRSAAWQVFRENRLGQISPGYLADMVVLDRDYLTVPDDELFEVKPVATMVGGRIVYDGF